MTSHIQASTALPTRPWLFHRALVRASLFICLLVSAPPVQAQQSGWTTTGSLSTPRSGHTATLLANGEVLVVGSYSDGGMTTASAELYDPATGRWSATGSLLSKHYDYHHLAVRLTNGKVLVIGGGTAEIYDPDTGVWSAAGDFTSWAATATLLSDGRVLVTSNDTKITMLYDPSTGAWSQSGTLNTARYYHEAALLPSGKVLVVGGEGAWKSAELYDPTTGRWTVTGDLINGRTWYHQVVLLPSGKVLVFGGAQDSETENERCVGAENAELYDPATGQWAATGNPISIRSNYVEYNSAALLPNGSVLLVGGDGPECKALKGSELYDPATARWSATASLNAARSGHTLTVLRDGRVLAVGGGGNGGNSAELFDSGTAAVTSISAASFTVGGTLAPESISSAFGANLAAETQAAPSLPLPTQIAGVSLKVRDRTGTERLAPLFLVSPGQINYQVPAGTAVGLATVTVTRGDSVVAAGLVEIAAVAPGLFSANATGTGVAAALALRVKADGTQQYEPVARFDASQNRFVPESIGLGPETDKVFLILFGTGIKLRSALSAVTATIGGEISEVSFAGAAPGYPGLDQVNLLIPHALWWHGEVDVVLTVDGKKANPLLIDVF